MSSACTVRSDAGAGFLTTTVWLAGSGEDEDRRVPTDVPLRDEAGGVEGGHMGVDNELVEVCLV